MACNHHILKFSYSEIFLQIGNGFLNKLLAVVMNGIDILVVNLVPKFLETLVCKVVVKLIGRSCGRHFLHHIFKHFGIEDTGNQRLHSFFDIFYRRIGRQDHQLVCRSISVIFLCEVAIASNISALI